jgi:hypothetical protein
MHPGCRRGRLDRHDRSAVGHQVLRPDHHDREGRQRDDRPVVRRGRALQVRQVLRQSDRCSAWASSPGWDEACPVRPGEHPDLGHGLRVDVVRQVGRHPARDAAHVPDPFPATRRTGCCPAAGCLDDAHRERQGVRRWNQAVAVEEQPVLRRSERRAQPGQGPAVRLGEVPPSGAAQVKVVSARPLVRLARPVRRAQSRAVPRRAPRLEPRRVPPAPLQPSLLRRPSLLFLWLSF